MAFVHFKYSLIIYQLSIEGSMLASAEILGSVTTGRLHFKTSNALVLNLRVEFRKALMYVYKLSNSEVTIRIYPSLLISLYFQKAS